MYCIQEVGEGGREGKEGWRGRGRVYGRGRREREGGNGRKEEREGGRGVSEERRGQDDGWEGEWRGYNKII